ncbi:MAG: protein kinase, partial [Phycisphaerales bacterium]|nr:protein kinase [Phycisphaerales bacterium]
GGQATVYRARRLKDDRIVAIKVLHAGPHADEEARARLKRETQALMALRHPNIVHALAAGRTRSGLDCLVMNYIDGRPLDALWNEPAFADDPAFVNSLSPLGDGVGVPPYARLRLFKKICEIIQTAHLKGITHRDLSPSNILIDKRGEPHILDFGMASTGFDRLIGNGKDITVTGQFIGKLKYASPEQARGSRDGVDIRTDVYALGVILYQILTNGAFPYEVVGNVIDVLNNIIHSKPRRPSQALEGSGFGVQGSVKTEPRISEPHLAEPRPSGSGFFSRRSSRLRRNPPLVNEAIEAIVLKALEKDPASRYQSAGELAADIDRYLAGLPTSAQSSKPARVGLSRVGWISIGIATTILLGEILMNLRTLMTWFGFATVAAPLAVVPPASNAAPSPLRVQEVGAEKRVASAATELMNIEARIRAVNKQLSAMGYEIAVAKSGPIDAAAFCEAIAKAAATEKPLAFPEADPAANEQAEKEEDKEIGKDAGMDKNKLLELRAGYEEQQAALWARIAWGAIDSRKIEEKPLSLFRYKLKAATDPTPAEKARRDVIEKGVTALRTADAAFRAASDALGAREPDAPAADDEAENAEAAKSSQTAAALAIAAGGMDRAITAFAKQAQNSAEVDGASDADLTAYKELGDLGKKLREETDGARKDVEALAKATREGERAMRRGSVQKQLIECVDVFTKLEQKLNGAAKEWGCEVEKGTPFAAIRLSTRSNAKEEKKEPEKKQQKQPVDPLADWTVGSKWRNVTPAAQIKEWTVRSRNGDVIEIERESRVKANGSVIVKLKIAKNGTLTVDQVYRMPANKQQNENDWNGKGKIRRGSMELTYSVISNGERWSESLQLKPDGN